MFNFTVECYVSGDVTTVIVTDHNDHDVIYERSFDGVSAPAAITWAVTMLTVPSEFHPILSNGYLG